MLGGGLFRGSSTLITGVPGTSKTTLSGKFAEAACRRGERTLFVSFDEGAERDPAQSRVGRNPAEGRTSNRGLLRMYSGRTESVGAEDHLVKLKSLIREHRPRCMVIDPLSAIAKAGGLAARAPSPTGSSTLAKDEKITVLVTAINEGDEPETEATDLQISTIADTWIHLSYLIRSGERNRALTIIKSRGTWHSNQVRELILSNTGPMLADVYTAGGEVLMGTLRWEKEVEEKAKTIQRRAEFDHKRGARSCRSGDRRASRPCSRISSGSGSNWRCTPATMRRTSFPRATGRRSCAGYAARIRPHARRPGRLFLRTSVTLPMVPERRARRRRAMVRKKKGRGESDPATATVVVMALYITDSGPNSVRAVANLEAICKEHLEGNFSLEIIDVLEYPQRALADGIVVTPSLTKLSPSPMQRSSAISAINTACCARLELWVVPHELRTSPARPGPVRHGNPNATSKRRFCAWSKAALSARRSKRAR